MQRFGASHRLHWTYCSREINRPGQKWKITESFVRTVNGCRCNYRSPVLPNIFDYLARLPLGHCWLAACTFEKPTIKCALRSALKEKSVVNNCSGHHQFASTAPIFGRHSHPEPPIERPLPWGGRGITVSESDPRSACFFWGFKRQGTAAPTMIILCTHSPQTYE